MSDPRTDADLVRSAAPYLAGWVATQAGFARVPGVQYAVLVGDEVVLDGAHGVADAGTGEPLRTDHLFRVASHSKTFCATAVLRLAERGTLRLDDALGTHVAELADTAVGRVTLREVLGHTGGVRRDGRDADFWQLGAPFPDRAALLATVSREGEVFGRGEHFKYSNLAYGLLGLAVEAVTGKPYAEHLHADVLEPAGLRDTFPDLTPEIGGRLVTGHSARAVTDDRRLPVAHVPTGALAAATGLTSTARDLVTWAAAHFAGDTRLLAPESQRLLQRAESTVPSPRGPDREYGLGFESREIEGRRVVGHSGGFPGQLTRTWWDPAGRVAVSVLTNAVDGPADGIANGLFALVATALSGCGPLPDGRSDVRSDVQPDAAGLARFEGRFANLWGLADVVRLGDRLWLIDPRGDDPLAGAEPLTPDGDALRAAPHGGFRAVGEPVEYVWDGQGRPAAIVVGGVTCWPADEYAAQRAELLAHPGLA